MSIYLDSHLEVKLGTISTFCMKCGEKERGGGN